MNGDAFQSPRLGLWPLLLGVPGLLLAQPAPVNAVSPADTMHFCVPFDYEQWRREHPRPAAKGLADLSVGEPRTVRMIYFLPNDRPYRQEVVDSMKVVIRRVQTFYAEQMQAHGYGNRTFRFETDTLGAPLVHRVDGQHPESHYLDTHFAGEIGAVLDDQTNTYFAVLENSTGRDHRGSAGGGGRSGKSGGIAYVTSRSMWAAAHELGHAFGLQHDFRNDSYLMSYGDPSEWDRLSACHAEFLKVHPYFNPSSLVKETQPPTIEHISPPGYPAGSESVGIQFAVGDSEGLHQVLLLVETREGHSAAGFLEVKACRGLSGERDTIVEFEYDGLIPSSFVSSLSDRIVHPIYVKVIDSEGDVAWTDLLLSEISPHLVATLEGHAHEVNSVSFSPEGTTLASAASEDDEIKLWHVNARKPVTTLKGHTRTVSSVSFSSRPGATLASGSWDQKIKLWNGKTGELIATLDGHTDAVTSVAFSSGGTTLASGSSGGTVKIWDVQTRVVIGTLEGDASDVTSVSFSPDGTILASAVEGDGRALSRS